MMKNKIVSAFENDKLEHKENIIFRNIYVMDLRNSTKNKQGIIIDEKPPKGTKTLLIENPTQLNVSATIFLPQCFEHTPGKEYQGCEGIFYPNISNNKTWILFFEIKNCKAKNISRWFKDAKEQIISTVQIFRNKGILTKNQKVSANISFPQRDKTDYYNQLFKTYETKKFRDEYNIDMKGTNKLTIKNEKQIV